MSHGYWELSSTEFIATEVQAGMTVIDAGANVGYYSVLMGDKIGANGFLYVIEPTPTLKSNLEKTLFLNGFTGRYQLSTAPLWSTDNLDIRFAVPNKDTKNSSIISDSHPAVDWTMLKITTLDALVPPGKSVDFIKVDVEGAEHELWRGMKRVLSESPGITVFLEYNAGRLHDPAMFLDDVVAAGFILKHLDPLKGPAEVSKDQLLSENFGHDWMLVLKR